MKTLYLILITAAINVNLVAQEIQNADSVNSDQNLSASIVGTWEHVSSTFPSGDVSTYHRKFQFFENGAGVCTRYSLLDTVTINFQWEIKDSIISLFEIRKNGKRIYADSQIISFSGLSKMYLKDAYCEDQTGKVSYYRKTESEIAKY